MLEEKVTLITGASRGLGRALALACAKEGANLALNSRSEDSLPPVAGRVQGRACAKEGATLVINSRSEDSLQPVVEEVQGMGGEVLSVAANVALETGGQEPGAE